MNNLAALCQSKGNFTEAGRLYERALAIKEKLLGSQHPDVAVTLNNLAVLYKSLGKYAEAEPLYLRSLLILRQTLGNAHPNVIKCDQNYKKLVQKLHTTESSPSR